MPNSRAIFSSVWFEIGTRESSFVFRAPWILISSAKCARCSGVNVGGRPRRIVLDMANSRPRANRRPLPAFQLASSPHVGAAMDQCPEPVSVFLQPGLRASCISNQPSGFGGCLPYLASYCAANLASSSGWHLKHCESGRSCSLHQSPFF